MSRLALKIALPVGLFGAVTTLIVPEMGLWTTVVTTACLTTAAYAAVHLLVFRRIAQIQAMLQRIRRGNFAELSAPPRPRGDELDVLRWKTYQTGQSLEEKIQEFKELESYRREFIGNVSHELKTPIFSVQGFTETLLDGALEDETVNRTFLEKILHNVNRLENLARDLSTITKIETDELEMSKEAFGVSEAFNATLEAVEVRAEQKSVTVRYDIPQDMPNAYGDRDRIVRVLVNLADNAIKYNEEGGTVVLQATTDGTDVEICVRDDGIGIPNDHLPRLTERFYRVDKSRSHNQGGTGLGLAIVKHILAAHDTTLHVESTPGEGSIFCFKLSAASALSTDPTPPSI